MKFYLYLAFWVFLSLASTAQKQDYRKYDYSKADTFAHSLLDLHITDAHQLADSINRNFEEKNEKARVVYCWIANSISYDCKGFHHRRKARKNLKNVMLSRTAVCSGYSLLFQDLCDRVGVRCTTISGYGKNSAWEIGNPMKKINHAWNAIMLDSAWYLVDATWGSGYTDRKVKTFTRRFNDDFFLTPPEELIYTHLPQKSKWQLTDTMIGKSKFFNFPLISSGVYKYELSSIKPLKGIIKTNPKRSIHFHFKELSQLPIAQIEIYSERGSEKVSAVKKGEYYEFDHKFLTVGNYWVNLIIDGTYSFSYYVMCEK